MAPGWHGCPERPSLGDERERASPEIASASSNRPELKLRVGNPPRRLIVLTRLAVPYVVNVFFALLMETAQSLATRRSSLLQQDYPPSRQSARWLQHNRLYPFTPEDGASRLDLHLLGYPWVSVTAIVAMERSLSPAGPTDITVTCGPNSSLRLFTKS